VELGPTKNRVVGEADGHVFVSFTFAYHVHLESEGEGLGMEALSIVARDPARIGSNLNRMAIVDFDTGQTMPDAPLIDGF
jgi:hypothetical protein